jgi:orotidine-5'-phosphate decarboxylase
MKLISQHRSIIPALDVDNLEKVKVIVNETKTFPTIGAYKIGFSLALRFGLQKVVEEIKSICPDKPVIYDHQKAATDIPETGDNFMQICKDADIDATIIFPLSGIATQKAWIKSAVNRNLRVIVGGMMTHPGFTTIDGGYLDSESIINLYQTAIVHEITDFVVPGTKPEFVKKLISTLFKEDFIEPVFYSPGLVTQGGDVSEMSEILQYDWHAIVGRKINNSDNIQKSVHEIEVLL